MPPKAKVFLQAWAVTTVGVLAAAHIVDGINYDRPMDLVVATLLLGLLNAFVRPVLMLLSLPLLLLTLGLFMLVINAGLLWFVGEVVKGFHVAGFWPAFKGALVIAGSSLVIGLLTGTGATRVSLRRGGPPPRREPPAPPSGGGPIIDV